MKRSCRMKSIDYNESSSPVDVTLMDNIPTFINNKSSRKILKVNGPSETKKRRNLKIGIRMVDSASVVHCPSPSSTSKMTEEERKLRRTKVSLNVCFFKICFIKRLYCRSVLCFSHTCPK